MDVVEGSASWTNPNCQGTSPSVVVEKHEVANSDCTYMVEEKMSFGKKKGLLSSSDWKPVDNSTMDKSCDHSNRSHRKEERSPVMTSCWTWWTWSIDSAVTKAHWQQR